ncbi:hypothetical protein TRICI_003483 [Trichomonascus ciferrii]|uniref:phosphomevalonate kinase n=1 Tax=Trichomonascus ciferrii TaxID=44093 RepID=A0A642V3U2_9ASCO|nr:hypothetical protein TRICI_003483 [Trichomonascus ciferrii]
MHAVVEGQKSDKTRITVKSPQFQGGEWVFENDTMSGKNPFVEAVIKTVLAYLVPEEQSSVKVTIYSDNAYHSQSSERSDSFVYHDKPISEVPKTGLGSSAALTVVLTAALLSYFSPAKLDLSSKATLQLVHNLAQLAHCSAQGKIGSGFDVAAATMGSIVYKRFPPCLLADVMQTKLDPSLVKSTIDQPWDVTMEPCSMPTGLSLLMGDVKGGSETPKMVSTVLKWKKEKPEESSEIWKSLDKSNMALINLLSKLNSLSTPTEYKWPLQGHLLQMSDMIKTIRQYLRLMSEKSGVPIEPPEQTRLLDACSSVPGVIGGVVPGAGGYDAICLVVLTDYIDQIIKTTQNDPNFKHVQWLDLREQNVGVRTEDPNSYPS